MAGREHHYQTHLIWTGNRGTGTSGYAAFSRDHEITVEGKSPILASSDPNFRGDAARWNPEDLLVASLSACHQLWYLHLCAVNGVVVTSYEDEAEGWMAENADGGGEFTRVLLKPRVVIASGDPAVAEQLHHEAHEKCFIARSVNFPVECAPIIEMA
ncbi:MAG: OsmC family protein [Caulobacteraceae bacterium]